MRIIVYNIAYGTGSPRALFHHICTMHRYLRTPHKHLQRIMDFILECAPDMLGLIEVDTGSYRTNFINQVEAIANHISHHHQSSNKYGREFFGSSIPILRKQANAILTKTKLPEENHHFFPVGFKKLIIEAKFNGVRLFLVHLAINKRVRTMQLSHLTKLAKCDEPVIIGGDFNTFSGEHELRHLQEELDLVNPNTDKQPTFPSWKPHKQLDFMLCSRSLRIKDFRIANVKFSDHLPLILDIEDLI